MHHSMKINAFKIVQFGQILARKALVYEKVQEEIIR